VDECQSGGAAPLDSGPFPPQCDTSFLVRVTEGPERRVSVREARALPPRLEEELAREGDIVLTRRGRPVARLSRLEQEPAPGPVSTAALRARARPAEVLIRQDPDER
jgi:antitoxin (DNA-binding transcriptional repressor) of toxin-antitoxin stability system